MVDNFNSARKRLQTSGAGVQVICVNGCCYGRSTPKSEFKPKGNYFKKCGQRFWELISGNENLYTELILPLGHEAEKRNREYDQAYDELGNKLSREFLNEYSNAQGGIDWVKLVRFNSSTPERTPKKTKAGKNQGLLF